jgi:hypothetical protein
VVGVFDGTYANLYLDGRLDSNGDNPRYRGHPLPTNTTTVQIGSNTGVRRFSGAIDDVKIWHAALTAADVAALYSQGHVAILQSSLTNVINSLNVPPQLKAQLLRFVQQIPTAISSLTPAQKATAIANLQFFITVVNRLESFNRITAQQASQLINLANEAIAALS